VSPAALPPLMQPPDLRKSKLVAGLLGILLGSLGVHRFYLGYIGIGIAQIVVTFVTCGIGAIWGLIEGVLILVGSGITTDSEGRPLKEQ
jgi:TM2 domain-containing membrane protein YozV